MQIFDIYTYNLKQIRFKDNKEYFDRLLDELGLKYTDMGFCFRADIDGRLCEKVVKQFENLSKYKKYFAESELYSGSSPEHQISSISVDDKGGIDLHINRDHIDDLNLLIKKVPRPISFGFMGVLLDNINWGDDFNSKPCFENKGSIITDHRFTNYYSNSIRFIKEFDYGNKLNIIEILIERGGDFQRLSPLPERFEALCARFGKPMAKRRVCVFDDAEKARLKVANEEIQQSINKNEYDHLFAEFNRNLFDTSQGGAALLLQPKGLSLKKIFTDIAKRHGFRCEGSSNGEYRFKRVNEHNHATKVSFMMRPFSSLLSSSVCVCGYNFSFCAASFPQIIADDEADAELYAQKVFETADGVEKRIAERLFLSYGKTPEWYDA